MPFVQFIRRDGESYYFTIFREEVEFYLKQLARLIFSTNSQL